MSMIQKKLFVISIIVLMLGFALQSCAGRDAAPTPSSPPERLGDYMVMYAEQNAFPVGTESITLLFDNLAEEQRGFGHRFTVQYLIGGAWVPLELKSDFVQGNAIILPPHGSTHYVFNFDRLKKKMKAGTYRMKLTEQTGYINELENLVFYFEFTLYDPK